MKPASSAGSDQGPLIAIIAGEASGDLIGARLIRALVERTGGRMRLMGVGGEAMAAEGFDSLFPMEELSLFGLLEVLPHLRNLRRRLDQTADAIAQARPDIVVTIDSPGFNRRLATRLKPLGLVLVHYVAPTVWAWRPKRAEKFAAIFDHLLALLPFEPPWFTRVGLPCTFVGHPAVEDAVTTGDGPGFRARHGIAVEDTVVLALPGSRKGEISRLQGPMGQALSMMAATRPGLRVVVPAIRAEADRVRAAVAQWALPQPAVVVDDAAGRRDAFAAADVAIAASGTVTLELARQGVPMVVVYRVNALTGAIARRLVRVPHVSLLNLVMAREIVPELLQAEVTADRIIALAAPLIDQPAARRAQAALLREALARLGGPADDGLKPSARAAAVVLDLAGRRRRRLS
ncbi:lipid-A-disaccharide synthase [Tistrella sp. BH-R2-4]|jgi:lipid-A-disaccharide synthase|uniref:Lipid-A-disaccharide synthase n=1 Tax=Tistrella arctica TaxID=3133430 RepID=A0ABU9YEQ4_9PROT